MHDYMKQNYDKMQNIETMQHTREIFIWLEEHKHKTKPTTYTKPTP